jgi:uncharacterized membrane protein
MQYYSFVKNLFLLFSKTNKGFYFFIKKKKNDSVILKLYKGRGEKKYLLIMSPFCFLKPLFSETNKNFREIIELKNKIVYVILSFREKPIFATSKD